MLIKILCDWKCDHCGRNRRVAVDDAPLDTPDVDDTYETMLPDDWEFAKGKVWCDACKEVR